MRNAVYYAPGPDAPLAEAAAAWLGRSPWSGAVPSAGTPRRCDAVTEAPRRYGFHATLKAPFRLAPGRSVAELRQALAALAASLPPVTIEHLELARIGSFFALAPRRPSPSVEALAGRVVRSLDPFRAPATEQELARRRAAGLSPAEERNLREWGYPYVFESFRFHMTLTGPVGEADRDPVERTLRQWFGSFLDRPLTVDALSLFVEPAPGRPFVAAAAWPLAQSAEAPA